MPVAIVEAISATALNSFYIWNRTDSDQDNNLSLSGYNKYSSLWLLWKVKSCDTRRCKSERYRVEMPKMD
jgi:hypothetical protein